MTMTTLTTTQELALVALGQGKEPTMKIATIEALGRKQLVAITPTGRITLTSEGQREYVNLVTREEAEVPDFDTPVRARVANRAVSTPKFVVRVEDIESPDEKAMRHQIAGTLGVDPSLYTLREFVSVLCARHMALEAEKRHYAAESAVFQRALDNVTNCF